MASKICNSLLKEGDKNGTGTCPCWQLNIFPWEKSRRYFGDNFVAGLEASSLPLFGLALPIPQNPISSQGTRCRKPADLDASS